MLRLALALVTSATILAGCGQGEGERCQVDGDCGTGLICHGAKKTCTDPATGGDADAGFVFEDAPPIPDAVVEPEDAPLPVDAALPPGT